MIKLHVLLYGLFYLIPLCASDIMTGCCFREILCVLTATIHYETAAVGEAAAIRISGGIRYHTFNGGKLFGFGSQCGNRV